MAAEQTQVVSRAWSRRARAAERWVVLVGSGACGAATWVMTGDPIALAIGIMFHVVFLIELYRIAAGGRYQISVGPEGIAWGWDRAGRRRHVALQDVARVEFRNNDTWTVALRMRRGKKVHVPTYFEQREAVGIAAQLRRLGVEVTGMHDE